MAPMSEPAHTITAFRRELVQWVKWWNGPGRRSYRGMILPPLTHTGELLACSICSGVVLPDGEYCRACHRTEGE